METVLEGALKARPGCGLVNGPHTVGWAGLGDDEQRGSAHVVVGQGSAGEESASESIHGFFA